MRARMIGSVAIAGVYGFAVAAAAWGAGALGRAAGREAVAGGRTHLAGAFILPRGEDASEPRALPALEKESLDLQGTGQAHMSHHWSFEAPAAPATQGAQASLPGVVGEPPAAEPTRDTVGLAKLAPVGKAVEAKP